MGWYKSLPSFIEAVQHTGDFVVLEEFAGDKVRINPETGGLELLAGPDGKSGWLPVPLNDWIASNPGDRNDLWPLDALRMGAKYVEATGPDLAAAGLP